MGCHVTSHGFSSRPRSTFTTTWTETINPSPSSLMSHATKIWFTCSLFPTNTTAILFRGSQHAVYCVVLGSAVPQKSTVASSSSSLLRTSLRLPYSYLRKYARPPALPSLRLGRLPRRHVLLLRPPPAHTQHTHFWLHSSVHVSVPLPYSLCSIRHNGLLRSKALRTTIQICPVDDSPSFQMGLQVHNRR